MRNKLFDAFIYSLAVAGILAWLVASLQSFPGFMALLGIPNLDVVSWVLTGYFAGGFLLFWLIKALTTSLR